jgi:TatD DNase family protein
MNEVLFFDAHTHDSSVQEGAIRVLSVHAGHSSSAGAGKGYFTCGLHPWYLEEVDESHWQHLLNMAAHPRCLGIGECGLDGLHENLKRQEYWFKRQIELAAQLNKPLVLHVVRRDEQARTLLKAARYQGRINVHGFRGGMAKAQPWLEMGAWLGISPAALKKPNPLFFQNIDPKRILAESDDSHQALPIIFADMAACLNMSLEDWKRQAFENAKLFYNV